MNIDINEFNAVLEQYLDRSISPEAVVNALKLGREKQFRKGELILGIGEKMTKVYFITKGIFRSYYIDGDGNDVTKSFLLEYSFGVAEGFFTDEPSCQSFEALENTEVIEFNVNELKEYILSVPELKDTYIKYLERTIVYKMYRESSFQLDSAAQRYLNFKKKYPNLEKRVKQGYIASYLGITPVSLSRIRRTLKED